MGYFWAGVVSVTGVVPVAGWKVPDVTLNLIASAFALPSRSVTAPFANSKSYVELLSKSIETFTVFFSVPSIVPFPSTSNPVPVATLTAGHVSSCNHITIFLTES